MVGRTGTPLEERRTAVGAVDVSDPSPRELTSAGADAASRVTVIRPASRLPRLDIAELWHYRELLWTLVWRDVAVRYKQTFLGVAWAILVPAFTALVYVIVFGKFANFPAGSTPYPSLVVAGVLPDAVLRVVAQPREPQLALEPARSSRRSTSRGRCCRSAACACRSSTSSSGCPCSFVLIWKYDTWPSGWETLTAPLFILLAVVTVLGIGLLLAGRQRALPGRPLHDPRLPPDAAAPLGRDVRRRPDPGEVAVDPRVQPDDVRDRRLALGRARRAPSPNMGQIAVGVAVALVLFVVGLATFRSSEPRFADTI